MSLWGADGWRVPLGEEGSSAGVTEVEGHASRLAACPCQLLVRIVEDEKMLNSGDACL